MDLCPNNLRVWKELSSVSCSVTMIMKSNFTEYTVVRGPSGYRITAKQPMHHYSLHGIINLINGVMTRSMVDTLSELCSPFLKGGNSTFIAVIASGLFPQTEYRSLR